MGPTTWDGHVRVDYVPESRRLQVTLATVEATSEAELRRGLRAGFVTADPDGPPAFLAADLPAATLPADLGELLGERIREVARLVIAQPPHSRWAQLDLVEVDDLAQAWAPYRAVVLSPAAGAEPRSSPARLRALGGWAGGLWARLGVDDLRDAVAALGPAAPALRTGDPFEDPFEDPLEEDDEPDGVLASGSWELPGRLAELGGVAPRLGWAANGGLVTITAHPLNDEAGAVIEVSFDDGHGRWAPLVATAAGTMEAVISSASDLARLPAVRVRAGVAG